MDVLQQDTTIIKVKKVIKGYVKPAESYNLYNLDAGSRLLVASYDFGRINNLFKTPITMVMIHFSCENPSLYFPWKVELAERQLHSMSKAHLLLQEGVLFVPLGAVRSEKWRKGPTIHIGPQYPLLFLMTGDLGISS